MNALFARARSFLRGLRRPGRLEAEMEEEMRFHLEMEAERLMRERGLGPHEARRQAAVAFGGREKYKEQGRDVRGLTRVHGVSLDLKLGLRMLRKYPGLTLVGGLALAVAIGGGAGYLELVNDLYRPTLPFRDGDRMVGLYNQDAATSGRDDRSLHDFLVWRRELQSVEELGVFLPLERNLITGDGRTEPVAGVEISASAFRLAGVPPLLGRPLVEEDERPGAAPVVVLGHDLWQARFGGERGVVGRTVRLGSVAHTVVGVMPDGFAFPVNHGLWVPFRASAAGIGRGEGPAVRIFGRLAPGVGLAEAQAELTALGLRAAADAPESGARLRPRIRPYVESIVSTDENGTAQRTVLYALNLFFLGLLGVCGANVATLVFARTATREGEIAVRTALGASRGRIVGQLFAEALVLASAAAAVGLAGAAVGLRWVRGTIEAAGAVPPFWWNDRLAPATLLYAAALTLGVSVLVGGVPALKATGPRLQARLKHAAAGGSSMRFGRLWTGVIIAQVALTVLFLLIVASIGWNVRVGRYGSPAPAFPAEQYLSVRLEADEGDGVGQATAAGAASRTRLAATYAELERRVAAEPGVTGITYATRLPGMQHPGLMLEVEGTVARGGEDGTHWLRTAAVEADFFDTFGAPVVSGRGFTPADAEPGRAVAIVDQAFVRLVLGGRDPVGLRVRNLDHDDPRAQPGPWYEIVGVVRDLTTSPDKSPNDAMLYRPAARGGAGPVQMAVHVRGDPRSLVPRLRAVAASVDPTLRLYQPVPLDEVDRAGELALAILLRVLAVVGAIALLLSTAGVYSLMSFTVARRTREIGIRAALGAAPRRVVTGVFRRAFAQIGAGILAGSVPGSLLVAWGAPEIARGGGPALGFAAFVAVAALMAGVGMFASAVPARRALRIQPTEALRADG